MSWTLFHLPNRAPLRLPLPSSKAREHLIMLALLLLALLVVARSCAAPGLARAAEPVETAMDDAAMDDAAMEHTADWQWPEIRNALDQPVQMSRDTLPTPRVDIPWSRGFTGLQDVVGAFNNARANENAQLGTFLKPMESPNLAVWQAMSDGEKALWLINAERTARNLAPLHGLERNVTQVAQSFAEYLLEHNAFDHNADGRTPWERLRANPTIGACHDFLGRAENLYSVGTTARDGVPLVIEQAVYFWIYTDAKYAWGHRHAAFVEFTENSGPGDREGFLGVGHARGPLVADSGPYKGVTMGNSHIVVMNIFDPCATWQYEAPPVVPPPPAPKLPAPPDPKPNTHAVSGQITMPRWVTITSQPFERDTWYGGWQVSDASGMQHGEYHWIASTCRVYAGEYSGMAIGGGANGVKVECGGHYPNNARSWMIYGPFSLEDAVAAELRAMVWVYTEPEHDMLCLLASTDRQVFNGPCVSGFSDGWVEEVLDLNQVYRMGSLLGRKEVYVALAFITNETETRPHNGAYVDNIVLRKGVAGTAQGSVGSVEGADAGSAEEPAARFGVLVTDQSGNYTMTNRDGEFVLQGLPPGRHRLTPLHTGHQFYPPYFMVDVTAGDVAGVGFTASASLLHRLYVPSASR